jgi:hypothetical protein
MMHPADLDTLAGVVDRELRHLPVPRAPDTLLPRVLAAVERWSRRPWYARAWFTWPVGAQVASVIPLILLLAGSIVLIPILRSAADGGASIFAPEVTNDVADAARRAMATMNAARVLWRTLIEPFVACVFVLVALMCLACAAFGTALTHVVVGKAAHS